MCLLTYNKEVAINADTSHAKSGRGEVSSWGPCRGASGPRLGGGDGPVRGETSTDNEDLHSDSDQNVVIIILWMTYSANV